MRRGSKSKHVALMHGAIQLAARCGALNLLVAKVLGISDIVVLFLSTQPLCQDYSGAAGAGARLVAMRRLCGHLSKRMLWPDLSRQPSWQKKCGLQVRQLFLNIGFAPLLNARPKC